jgi:crotonobetainyl-CoA:carnitine CoA-transferase CaiB-like acyl-CoA transferase
MKSANALTVLGEHTSGILTGLSYDRERIEKLKKDKVVFW